MAKIIGTPIATPLPKPDWNQTDSTKGDFINNKPEIPADVVYAQSPNLYDGQAEAGSRNYTTGKPTSSSNHARNKNRIDNLDPNKSYNIQLKKELADKVFIYIFLYDANGNLISQDGGVKYLEVLSTNVAHISGAKGIDFFVQYYTKNYGIDTNDDGVADYVDSIDLMVWEDTETRPYTEYLNYGETSRYYKTKLLLNEKNLAEAMLKRDKAKFDSSFNYIAYSGQVSGWYANTAQHYEWCAKQGSFTALKGDIQLTSDNKIIMCHDIGFTLNDDDRIVTYNSSNPKTKLIHDLTEAECLALEFVSPTNGVYSHPANLDTYLFICKKYGMIPYITIRDNYIDETVNVLLEKLNKFNLRDRAIINSFTYETLKAVREKDAAITLSRVQTSGIKITNDVIDRVAALGNCMVCGFDFGASQGGINNLTESVMAYAREKDIRVYEALCSMSDVDDLIKLGVAGAQISSIDSGEVGT